MKRALGLIACLALCGCESFVQRYITQPAPAEVTGTDLCRINRHFLDVQLPPDPVSPAATAGYGELVRSAFDGQPGDLLFMSGGSQHGAFGAGILDGWQKRDGALPEFRVVTGISTGALLSTGAFINRPDISVRGYSIAKESELLETYITGDQLSGGLPVKVITTTLKNGAFADLIPLRDRLSEIFTPDVFQAVHERGQTGAKLFVGATDVDAGAAVAFDMTDLASRYVAATSAEEKAHIKSCYIEALVASSIVPPGARPNFIDNRMYIDGGAKFAVFAEDIGARIEDFPVTASVEEPDLRNIYILVNGNGENKAVCGKVDEKLCKGDGPDLSLSGQHADWTVPDLAGRSLQILIDQVARLSVDRAANIQRTGYNDPVFIRIIEKDKDAFTSDLGGAFGGATKSCADWRKDDDTIDKPIEFHPRYMQCLIDYGRHTALIANWGSD